MSSRLAAIAELMRLSNAPTVISNVVAGACLCGALGGEVFPAGSTLVTLGLTVGSGVLLYSGGMILNDVADASTDRVERPGRPIPSGRVSVRTGAILSMVCFGLAWALARCTTQNAALVALCIVVLAQAYDFIHTRSRWSVVLLGLCRAGLYLLAAAAFSQASPIAEWQPPRAVLIAAAGLAVYIVGFSLIARHEAQRGTRASIGAGGAIALLAVAAAGVPILVAAPRQRLQESTVMVAVALAALILAQFAAAFAGRRGRLRAAVMQWIASISLIDATLAAAFGSPAVAGLCLGCWLLTLLGQRRMAGS